MSPRDTFEFNSIRIVFVEWRTAVLFPLHEEARFHRLLKKLIQFVQNIQTWSRQHRYCNVPNILPPVEAVDIVIRNSCTIRSMFS